MHVDRLDAGLVEGGGHLDVTVDALLAQDRDPRANAGGDAGRGDIVVDVEARCDHQAWGVGPGDGVEGLARAIGVVAQCRHPVAGFRPGQVQRDPRTSPDAAAVAVERDVVAGGRLADHVGMPGQAGLA